MDLKDYKITVDNLTIYYRIAGDPKKQTLIFLHGWAARKQGLWGNDKVIIELAKYFYVIAPEHPGLIRSEAPKTIWNYKDYANLLDKLLLKLNVKQFIIMGQSWGGGLASVYSFNYPSKVKTLIIVDGILGPKIKSWYSDLSNFLPYYSRLLGSRFTPKILKKLAINLYFGTPFENINENVVKEKILMTKLALNNLNDPNRVGIDYTKLKAPLVLVWGDKDTYVCPIDRAREIHKKVENSKLVVVKGGHTILYQNPKYVVSELVNSL